MAESTALANPNGQYQVLTRTLDEMQTALQENLGIEGVKPWELPRATNPQGVIGKWMIPTMEGEDAVDAIEGIIMYWRPIQRFDEKPYEETGGQEPPTCFGTQVTRDEQMIMWGKGKPGGMCRDCKLNQWVKLPDSTNQPPVCNERRVMFVLTPNTLLPLVLSIPPTGLGNVRKYMMKLSNGNVVSSSVVTRFTLVEATRTGGKGTFFRYGVPTMVRKLDEQEVTKVRAYADFMRPGLEQDSMQEFSTE